MKVVASQIQSRDFESSPKQVTKDLELRIFTEYLINPKTRFRKLERQFMEIDSPARGGGFEAKRIVNFYGVTPELKDALSNCIISRLVEVSVGRCKAILLEIEKKL